MIDLTVISDGCVLATRPLERGACGVSYDFKEIPIVARNVTIVLSSDDFMFLSGFTINLVPTMKEEELWNLPSSTS